jgi:hypothetical protein
MCVCVLALLVAEAVEEYQALGFVCVRVDASLNGCARACMCEHVYLSYAYVNTSIQAMHM